jgi:peptidyl-prolyl cis-trans isomerase B (cyclophilin B)
MGKIQKLREQKKLDALAQQEQKTRRNKKIITYTIAGLAILGVLIYGLILLFNPKNNPTQSTNASITPLVSASPPSLFPSSSETPSATPSETPATTPKIVIETARGNIELELFPTAAPKTVANFLDLISKGFYNGLTFHRVVPGFVIQGGDPKGDGTGGPGYTFADEINPWSLGLSDAAITTLQTQDYQYRRDLTSHKMVVGSLAMANAGPNTNGSQFFIVTDQNQPSLDGKHTVFGQVIGGMDVVRKIQQGDIIKKIAIEE